MGKLEKNKLKVVFENDELVICGNKEGLEYLSDCCLRIIGKHDPSGHIHLMPQMNNLVKGSLNTVVLFSDDPADYDV